MNNIYFDSHEFATHDNVKFIFASIIGVINKHTLKDLEKFYTTLTEKKHSIIGLSLSQIEYIDSTGLGILANFQQKCRDLEIDLKLVAISPKILHLFEMLGMTSFFEIYESNVDLVQKLKSTDKISADIDFYLRKMNELKQKTVVKNSSVIPREKNTHMEIVLPYKLHVKKIQNFYIQLISNENVKEIILSCDGCIIQPPSYHIRKNTNKISFSITPIIHQSEATLKIHLFSQKSCIYELPIQIKSNKYRYFFFPSILIILAFIYQYFFSFFIFSTTISFLFLAIIWKFQKRDGIVKYLLKI